MTQSALFRYSTYLLLLVCLGGAGCRPAKRKTVKKEKGENAMAEKEDLSPAVALSSRLKPTELNRKIEHSLVVVKVVSGDGEPGALGTGFFVGPDLIATNYHVIESGVVGNLYISPVNTDENYPVGRIVATDQINDLALLKVSIGNKVPVLKLNTDRVEVGEDVYVKGNPLGLEATFSNGVISGYPKLDGHNFIQFTAPISHGNSGGPLVAADGRVIGVVTATIGLEGSQNINFAVPSRFLKALIEATRNPE